EHPHIVSGGPVEAFGCRRHAAEDVASADDEAELMPLPLCVRNLLSKAGNGLRIYAELPLPHQSLARELQEDAIEAWAGHSGELSSRCNKGGHAFMAQSPRCQLPYLPVP